MGLAQIGAAITLDGEKEYKQAIGNINQSMAVLKSELKLTSAEFDGQANSIGALEKKNRILSAMYDEQARKAQTMAGALEEAARTYGENSRQAQDWQIRLNAAHGELTRLDRELQTNAGYLEEARHSSHGAATSIDEYGNRVSEASDETLTFGDILKANLTSELIIEGVKALASAMKSIGDAAIDTVKETAAYADNILTLSNNTGVATDTLQELNYMQELTDVSLEQVTSSMAKQIKAMDNARKGSKDYVETYDKLGVSIQDANGELRNSEDVYWEIIDALGKVSNETERDTLSMKLFGKSAQDLNSLIKLGSKGVKEFAQEARDMGAVLDDETLSTLGEADDAFQRIDQSLAIFKRELGVAMAPSITKSIDKVVEKLTEMGDEISEVAGGALEMLTDGLVWILDNAELIKSALIGIGTGFLAFKSATAISLAITKLEELSLAAHGTTSVIKGLMLALASNPIAIAAAGIGVLTAAVVYLASKTESAKSETELFNEEVDKAVESSKKLRNETKDLFASQDQEKVDIESSIGKYQVLADKLFDIAEAENISNEQKTEMKMLVEQLNKAFPEMGLTIDSVTGKLNKQRNEVDKLLSSYMEQARVTAAKRDIEEIGAAEYEAYNEKIKLTDKLTKAEDELTKAEEKFRKKTGRERDRSGYWDAKKAVKELKEQVEEQDGIIAESSTRYGSAVEYIQKYDTSLKNTSQSSDFLAKATEQMVANTTSSLDELVAKYEEIKTAAEESLLKQIGLFDEFTNEVKYSKEEIFKNLQSQIDGLKNWAENMDKASELGISENLLRELRAMGVDSAGYLSELVKMNDDEIKKLNSLWRDKLTMVSDTASTTAKIETNFSESLNRIKKNFGQFNIVMPEVSFNPEKKKQIQENNVISDDYRQQLLAKPEINVYLGNERIAGAITKVTTSTKARFNPLNK